MITKHKQRARSQDNGSKRHDVVVVGKGGVAKDNHMSASTLSFVFSLREETVGWQGVRTARSFISSSVERREKASVD